MPTVLRINGLRFVIYTNDHAPMHVHVESAEFEAVFIISPVIAIRENHGFKAKQVSQIEEIIMENFDLLVSEWRRIHG